MNNDNRRAEILAEIKKAPMISSCAGQLLAMAGKGDHGVQDLVRIINCDAVLTGRILQMANSTFYSPASAITDLVRAVAILGENAVVSIAIAAAAGPLFDRQLSGYAGERGALWNHDLRAAIASKKVARHAIQPLDEDVVFTCGLLHDLGKALLSSFLGEAASILDDIEHGRVADYLAAEQRLLGIDHAEAGFHLARLWKLPEPLPTAIRHHHQPAAADARYRSLVYAVHLGDIIAMMGGYGTGADGLGYHLDQRYAENLPMSDEQMALVLLETEEDFRRIAESLRP